MHDKRPTRVEVENPYEFGPLAKKNNFTEDVKRADSKNKSDIDEIHEFMDACNEELKSMDYALGKPSDLDDGRAKDLNYTNIARDKLLSQDGQKRKEFMTLDYRAQANKSADIFVQTQKNKDAQHIVIDK